MADEDLDLDGGEEEAPKSSKKMMIIIIAGVTLLLAGLGMWQSRSQWQLSWPILILFLYYTAVHAFLFSKPRYFVPLVPYVLLFAAAGIVYVADLLTDIRHTQMEKNTLNV